MDEEEKEEKEEKENDKSHIDWRNRDWLWLVGILITIIILLIAGHKTDKLELNFSIISSAVSIALALVAIFIALKQDSDNQRVNYKVEYKLEQIVSNLKNVDDKVNNVVTNILTNVAEETADTFSSDDLVEKKEQYSKEEVEELLNSYNKQIKDTLNKVVNQNKSNNTSRVTVYGSDVIKLEDKLLSLYPIGHTVISKDLVRIMKELDIRSTPSKLLVRLIRNDFLEPIMLDDDTRGFIIKGPKR